MQSIETCTFLYMMEQLTFKAHKQKSGSSRFFWVGNNYLVTIINWIPDGLKYSVEIQIYKNLILRIFDLSKNHLLQN